MTRLLRFANKEIGVRSPLPTRHGRLVRATRSRVGATTGGPDEPGHDVSIDRGRPAGRCGTRNDRGTILRQRTHHSLIERPELLPRHRNGRALQTIVIIPRVAPLDCSGDFHLEQIHIVNDPAVASAPLPSPNSASLPVGIALSSLHRIDRPAAGLRLVVAKLDHRLQIMRDAEY